MFATHRERNRVSYILHRWGKKKDGTPGMEEEYKIELPGLILVGEVTTFTILLIALLLLLQVLLHYCYQMSALVLCTVGATGTTYSSTVLSLLLYITC
jgi:hypothetical protein